MLALALLSGLSACQPSSSSALSRQQLIIMDGSSTLFPLAEAFAEDFQHATGMAVAVGSSSSSGGLNRLCHAEIDIATASRPMTSAEMQQCRRAGIEYLELPVALDAIALVVHPQNHWVKCLSTQQLKQIWQPQAQGVLTHWQQVDAGFPASPLRLYGAGVSSGTYDYFTATIVGRRHASRGDYAASEDDNITVRGVAGDRQALGFVGLSYYLENRSQLQAVAIQQPDGQCRRPDIENAQRGQYLPLTRALFMYVAKKPLQQKPGLHQFVTYMLDIQRNQRVSSTLGFVALTEPVLQRINHKLQTLQAGSVYGGGFAGNITEQPPADLFASHARSAAGSTSTVTAPMAMQAARP